MEYTEWIPMEDYPQIYKNNYQLSQGGYILG